MTDLLCPKCNFPLKFVQGVKDPDIRSRTFDDYFCSNEKCAVIIKQLNDNKYGVFPLYLFPRGVYGTVEEVLRKLRLGAFE